MECGTIPASFVSVGEGREGVSWGGVGGSGEGEGEGCMKRSVSHNR